MAVEAVEVPEEDDLRIAPVRLDISSPTSTPKWFWRGGLPVQAKRALAHLFTPMVYPNGMRGMMLDDGRKQ